MATQALYLKYRPQTFDEVAGQDAITRTLRNALRHGKIRHAYLLTGPRGTGKTTTARLLAKAVNCQAEAVEDRPCNQCSTCVAINEGRLLDLIEIDAASNRGIDEIRDIREKVGFRPSEGRYKVYVLDEAHMLTEPAFNALLKTLEEPPPHVIFTLVTTDPHKIPATIASRCQRFDFRRISVQAVADRLDYIAGQEGLTIEPEALEFIAHQGTGAMRDAISLLDQLTSYGQEITLAQVQMVLGTTASEAAGKLAACLIDGDISGGLDLINRTVNEGADPRQFGREVVEVLRGLLLIREGAGTRTLNLTTEQAAEMEALAERVSVERLVQAIRLFNEATTDLRRGLQTIPQLPLELALVEFSLEPGASQATAQPVHQERVVYQATSRPASSESKIPPATPSTVSAQSQAEVGQAPEQAATPVAAPAPAPSAPEKAAPASTEPAPRQPAAPAAGPAAPTAQAPGGEVSLAQVEGAWGQILQAVRQRNPLVEGALRTNCKPVEVYDDEIVIAFPYPFLRDKLGDPRRRAEIQDALTEVLGARCRIKLVMESEYRPRPRAANPARTVASEPDPQRSDPPPPGLHGAAPQAMAPAGPQPSGLPAAAPSLAPTPPEDQGQEVMPAEPAPDAQATGDIPIEISRWAEEHGAEIKIVPD